MSLVLALIVTFFVLTQTIAPFGQAIILIVVGGLAGATLVVLALFALRRAGVHRFAEVRTWPRE